MLGPNWKGAIIKCAGILALALMITTAAAVIGAVFGDSVTLGVLVASFLACFVAMTWDGGGDGKG